MVSYGVWFKDSDPYEGKNRAGGFRSLREAREWARKGYGGGYAYIFNDATWHVPKSAKDPEIKGIVYFDDGLGWVYVHTKSLAKNKDAKMDSVYELYPNGTVSRFTKPVKIRNVMKRM